MLKKVLAIFLTLALLLTLVPMSVFAVDNTAVQTQATSGSSGNCGTESGSYWNYVYADNATFTLDTDGVLTISGTGKIGNDAFNRRSDITSVVFAPGSTISEIGEGAFWDCSLTNIAIPDSVTTMGEGMFGECYDITTIKWPRSVTTVPYDDIFVDSNWVSIDDDLITSFYYDGSPSDLTIEAVDDGFNLANMTFYNLNGGDILDASVANPMPVRNGYIFDGWYTALIGGTECTAQQSAPGTGTTVYAHWTECDGTCGTYDSSTGTYGDNAYYMFNSTTGVLTIYGTGEVGENAFGWGVVEEEIRNDITSVVFAPGSTISTIGEHAFNDLDELADITLPNTITTIEEGAFQSCSALTSITIPDSVTSMGRVAFDDCESLTSATWGSGCATIPDSTFYACPLTSFTIPNTVTTIGESAFEGTNITSIIIPNSVTSMGAGVFGDCDDLESVTWNNTLTTIPADTFSGCSSLSEVTLGTALTSIGSDAFSGVNNVTTLHYNCSNLVDLSNLFSRAQVQTLTVGGTGTAIPYGFMQNNNNLTSVTIYNGVASIGGSAFENCQNLTSVEISNSVTSMGTAVFSGCEDLESVTWGSGLTSIPEETFYGCVSLENFVIPSTVTAISYAFGNTGLTSITIPDSVEEFTAGNVFDNCSNLTTVKYSKHIDYVSDGMFENSPNITSFYRDGDPTAIYDELTNLYHLTLTYYHLNGGDILDASVVNPVPVKDGYTFAGWYTALEGGTRCTAQQSAPGTGTIVYAHWQIGENCGDYDSGTGTYDDNATYTIDSDGVLTIYGTGYIGELAFANRDDITSVVFAEGSSIEGISTAAFNHCSLTSITLPDTLESIDWFAFANSGLTSIVIPSTVTGISDGMFKGCKDLTSVTWNTEDNTIPGLCFAECSSLTNFVIPDTVEYIYDGAFDGTGLTNIVIPDSVQSINKHSFYTPSLQAVYFEGDEDTPSMNDPYDCDNAESFEERLGWAEDTFDQYFGYGDYASDGPNSDSGFVYHWYHDASYGEGNNQTPYELTGRAPTAVDYFLAYDVSDDPFDTKLEEYAEWDGWRVYEAGGELDESDLPLWLRNYYLSNDYNCIDIENYIERIDAALSLSEPQRHDTLLEVWTEFYLMKEDWHQGSFYPAATFYYPAENEAWQDYIVTYEGQDYYVDVIPEYGLFGNPMATYTLETGNCGSTSGDFPNYTYDDNATYELRNGFMTIYGEGSIGDLAFANRDDIDTVIFAPGSSIEGISTAAFNHCSLTSITLPDTLTSMDWLVFANSGLTSIVIPETVDFVSDRAFLNCKNLTNVVWNASYNGIDDCCFAGCSSLTSFVIPDTITSIGGGAFAGTGITNIVIPDSVSYINDNSFNTPTLTGVYFEGDEDIPSMNDPYNGDNASDFEAGYIRYAEERFDEYFGYGDYASGGSQSESGFANEWYNNASYGENSDQTPYELTGRAPTAVDYFLAYDVNWDPFETKLEEYAEWDIWRYYEAGVELEASDLPLWLRNYYLWNNYKCIDIEDYIERIDAALSLSEPQRHDTLLEVWTEFFLMREYWHQGSFYPAATFYYPAENEAWQDSIVTYEGQDYYVDVIPEYGFFGNPMVAVGDVTLGNDSGNCGTSLGGGEYAKNATYTLHNGILTISGTGEIGENAFDSRDDILFVVFADGSSIVRLENDVFNTATLTNITLPDTLEEIGPDCFGNCANLKSITIPDTVTEIGDSAFYNCNSLESVYFEGNLPTLGYSCFDDEALYYPLGNTSWESELVRKASDNTFHLGSADGYLVATNAVIVTDQLGNVTTTKFFKAGQSLDLNSGTNGIISSAYNVTDSADAPDSISLTDANVQTVGGVTYASSTPFVKVIRTSYETLGTVAKDSDDTKILAGNATSYNGFDLFGAQIRQVIDDEETDGLRFVTSFSKDLMDRIHDLDDASVEYGYVVGVKSRIDQMNSGNTDKLYKGMPGTKTYNCTKDGNESDHQNYDNYRIFSLVITYNGDDAAYKSTDIVARAYITYTDADGVTRTYYNDYTGTQVRGGICTNYSTAKSYVNNVLKN